MTLFPIVMVEETSETFISASNAHENNFTDGELTDDDNAEDSYFTDEECFPPDGHNDEAYYDYEQYDNRECGPTIMFLQSNILVLDVLLMCRTYWIRFNSIDAERAALLLLIKTLAGPNIQQWKASNYLIARTYDPPKDKIILHFYCTECDEPLCKVAMKDNMGTIVMKCQKCRDKYKVKSTSPNCIWSIDFEYQMQQLLNQKHIQIALFKNIVKIRENESNKVDNVMRDVYDGELYKDIQRKYPGVLSFNFSMDVAPTNTNSSLKSFWPCEMIINELPPKLRFKTILRPALWVTKSEPIFTCMNLYM